MATIVTKRLGYGGSSVIDGIQVLITGGSFDQTMSVSYLDPWEIPPTQVKRSRVKHADGVSSYSGSVSLDVTKNAMLLFGLGRLLDRNFNNAAGFDVGIHDGENQYRMTACKVSSISLSGSANGLIAASVAFMGTTGKGAEVVGNDYVLNYTIDPDDRPAAYWWSGNTDVRDWTFTFNQDTAPVYSNENTMEPRYIRVGLVSYSLAVTTYEELDHEAINIITTAFTLVGDTTSKGYTYGGPTDLGMYSHSFETAATAAAGSSGVIITS